MRVEVLYSAAGDLLALSRVAPEGSGGPYSKFVAQEGQKVDVLDVPAECIELSLEAIFNAVRVQIQSGNAKLVVK
ncbi:hypothetical protein ABZ752_09915 [Streptomyces roseifaciens]